MSSMIGSSWGLVNVHLGPTQEAESPNGERLAIVWQCFCGHQSAVLRLHNYICSGYLKYDVPIGIFTTSETKIILQPKYNNLAVQEDHNTDALPIARKYIPFNYNNFISNSLYQCEETAPVTFGRLPARPHRARPLFLHRAGPTNRNESHAERSGAEAGMVQVGRTGREVRPATAAAPAAGYTTGPGQGIPARAAPADPG